MAAVLNEHKMQLGVQWIKGESGTTYLCPTAALKRLEDPTEQQLQTICVDESDNPHNE